MKTIFVCILLCAAATAQQQLKHDGNWWNDSGDGFRLGFVSGYLMSMISVEDAAYFRWMGTKGVNAQTEPKVFREMSDVCGQTPEVKAYQSTCYPLGQ